MFCAPGLVYGGTDRVGSLFHILRSRTRFRRYRVRRVPFPRFKRPDSFSAVPRVSLLVFMFSAPGHVFGDTKGVRSYFHVLRSRTLFRRYRGRRVPFSCFARPDSFSTVSRASGPIFLFGALGLVFDRTEGIGSRFHVLRSRTCFRRVPFSCFVPADSFSAVPWASGPVFTFCASGLVFGVTGGVGSRFLILRARTQGRRVPFSSLARPYSFSAVPRASGPVFLFCAPGLIFGGSVGVGSRFHVLRAWTRFRRY
jgi:hypothetical protein